MNGRGRPAVKRVKPPETTRGKRKRRVQEVKLRGEPARRGREWITGQVSCSACQVLVQRAKQPPNHHVCSDKSAEKKRVACCATKECEYSSSDPGVATGNNDRPAWARA